MLLPFVLCCTNASLGGKLGDEQKKFGGDVFGVLFKWFFEIRSLLQH